MFFPDSLNKAQILVITIQFILCKIAAYIDEFNLSGVVAN